MVTVFAWSAVIMNSSPSHIKPKIIKFVFAASLLSMQHQGLRAKIGCLGIKIMRLMERHVYPLDCCFSVGLVQSGQQCHFIECNLFSL